jgi:hypothetical protein
MPMMSKPIRLLPNKMQVLVEFHDDTRWAVMGFAKHHFKGDIAEFIKHAVIEHITAHAEEEIRLLEELKSERERELKGTEAGKNRGQAEGEQGFDPVIPGDLSPA